jgi:hypothetical protein
MAVKSRWTNYVFMALGVALIGALALVGAQLAGGRGAGASEDAPSTMARENNPLVTPCNGEEIAADRLAEAVSFEPYRPHDQRASSFNEAGIWDCPEDGVIIEYRSGISFYMGVNTQSDPEAAYATLAANYPEEMEVGTARGKPALIARIYERTGAVGGVSVVEDGIRLIVNGNGSIPVSDLKRVVESLRQDGSESSPKA